jgi:hypothetical protein
MNGFSENRTGHGVKSYDSRETQKMIVNVSFQYFANSTKYSYGSIDVDIR